MIAEVDVILVTEVETNMGVVGEVVGAVDAMVYQVVVVTVIEIIMVVEVGTVVEAVADTVARWPGPHSYNNLLQFKGVLIVSSQTWPNVTQLAYLTLSMLCKILIGECIVLLNL